MLANVFCKVYAPSFHCIDIVILLPLGTILLHLTTYDINVKSAILRLGVNVIILLLTSILDVMKKWLFGCNSQREYWVSMAYENVIIRVELSNNIVLEFENTTLKVSVP